MLLPTRAVCGFLWLGGSKWGEGGGGGNTLFRWGFGGCAPEKNSKLFTLKCVFMLICQLILNTERGYSWLMTDLWLYLRLKTAVTKPIETCDI
jgi:hypothetical protein